MAQLEERLAPRKLTQEGQKLISERILPFPDIVGDISSSPQEIESMRLESGIHAALSMGGWKMNRGVATHTPMWPGGVSIHTSSPVLSSMAGVALAKALNEVGIFAVVMPILKGGEARISVVVGPKPDAGADLSGADASISAVMQMIGETMAKPK